MPQDNLCGLVLLVGEQYIVFYYYYGRIMGNTIWV